MVLEDDDSGEVDFGDEDTNFNLEDCNVRSRFEEAKKGFLPTTDALAYADLLAINEPSFIFPRQLKYEVQAVDCL